MPDVTYLRPASTALARSLYLSNDSDRRTAVNAALDDMARALLVLRQEGADQTELLDIAGFLFNIAADRDATWRAEMDEQGLLSDAMVLNVEPLERAFAAIEKPACASEYLRQRNHCQK